MIAKLWRKIMAWGRPEDVVAQQPEEDVIELVEVAEVTEDDIDNVLSRLGREEVEGVIKGLCTSALRRLRQEVVGENEDGLDRTVRKYRSKVARRTWHVAQKWCKWTDEGPVLMPDNTRLYYRKGHTEVIVQEYAPQVRLMKFKGALAKRNSTDEHMSQGDKERVYTYSLALPYMVFIYRFLDGLFSECYVAFSDRPLKRLQERPLRPYLSNLDSNLKLCHGASFHRGELVKGDLIQQVALVLNNFWQTIYSDEWGAHFWANKSHFINQVEDSRMASMDGWQEASLENPLFVIEDVNWLQHTEENFGDMVVRLFEHETDDAGFQQELYNDLVENFLDEVKKVIEENMQSAEQKAVVGLEDVAKDMLTRLAKLGKN